MSAVAVGESACGLNWLGVPLQTDILNSLPNRPWLACFSSRETAEQPCRMRLDSGSW